jgi:hypothetical protein
MADHPLQRRGVRLGRRFRVGALALAALLLAGCGDAQNGAKVEAGLRDYISGLHPGDGGGPFPVGAGPPRVKDKGCKDRHVTTKNGQVYTFRETTALLSEGLALWSCVVTFRNGLTLPVVVAVKGSEVGAVFAGASPDSPKQPPPRVYQGG